MYCKDVNQIEQAQERVILHDFVETVMRLYGITKDFWNNGLCISILY
jgi:hypothetical protein